MLAFYLSIAALLLLSLVLMLRVLRKSGIDRRVDHERMNIALSKDELKTLRESHAAGHLDDTEFAAAKSEIEKNLAAALPVGGINKGSVVATTTAVSDTGLRSRWRDILIVLVVVPFVAGLSGMLYLKVGDRRALDPDFVASMQPGGGAGRSADAQSAANQSAANQGSTSQAGTADGKLPSIEELLPKLEAHLQSTPDDAQGWTLLGTTYLRLRRFTDAEDALSRALTLLPDNPDIMLQLADTKAMLAQGSLEGEPAQLVDRALELLPDDPKAIWLKGMASQQSGDYPDAIARWEQLLPVMQDDPQAIAQLQSMIAEAKSEQGASDGKPASPAAPANTPTNTPTSAPDNTEPLAPAADTAAGLAVDVSLDAEFVAEVAAGTTLYIYAKAQDGPPMPLAVVKKSVDDLPMTVRLDDTMAMIPAMTLSSFEKIIVGARVSKTGNPVAQPGDLFGEFVGAGNTGQVSIVINQRVQP